MNMEIPIILEVGHAQLRIDGTKQISILEYLSRVNLELFSDRNRPVCCGELLVDDRGDRLVPLYHGLSGNNPTVEVEVSVRRLPTPKRSPVYTYSQDWGEGMLKLTHEDNSGDLLSHFLSDMGSTRLLFETYRRWLVKCGPLRILTEQLHGILNWKRPEATLLLLIVFSWLCVEPEKVLLFLVLGCVVGWWYFHLLTKHRLVNALSPLFEDFQANIRFNESAMLAWCRIYDHMNLSQDWINTLSRAKLYAQIVVVVFYIVPINWSILGAVNLMILMRSPLLQSQRIVAAIPGSIASGNKCLFEVFENQRWWLGSWSDRGLTIGTDPVYPWSDRSGHEALSKSAVTLPDSTWMWDSLWHIDKKGWMYAINFTEDESSFHPEQRPSDFVRRRRWLRTCKPVKPIYDVS
jgi:hypothetical protein